MNAYPPMGRTRIQLSDFSAVLRATGLAGDSLTRLEWQRGCQADAEVDWRLKHNGVHRHSGAPRVSLQQTIAAALIKVGTCLTGIPHRGLSPETAPAGTSSTAG